MSVSGIDKFIDINPRANSRPRSGFSINGIDVKAEGIKELKDNISFDSAFSRLQKNGLDEVYFVSDPGTDKEIKYVAYADGLELSGVKDGPVPIGHFNNKRVFVEKIDDELNTCSEGVIKTAAVAGAIVGGGTNIVMATKAAGAKGFGVFMAHMVKMDAPLMAFNVIKKETAETVAASGVKGILYGAIGAVAGGAVAALYGHFKGQDYSSLNGVVKSENLIKNKTLK